MQWHWYGGALLCGGALVLVYGGALLGFGNGALLALYYGTGGPESVVDIVEEV